MLDVHGARVTELPALSGLAPSSRVGRTNDLAAQLAVLGLPADEIRIYLALLRTGGRTVAELGATIGLATDRVADATETLIEIGFAIEAESGATVVPVSPEPGIEMLTLRRQEELRRARSATLAAYRECDSALRATDGGERIEVVTGACVPDRLRQWERIARHRIRRLDSPPYHGDQPDDPDEPGGPAEQGPSSVRSQVVYARSAPARRPADAEQARVLAEVPMRLTIVDDTVAVVAAADTVDAADTAIDDAPARGGTLYVVQPGDLFRSVERVFELCWTAARPLAVRPDRTRPVDRRILALLADGAGDDAIARNLGLSRRTVSRHLQRLTTRAGATTRFQLAVYATRHHWF